METKLLLFMRKGSGNVILNECKSSDDVEEIIRDRLFLQPKARANNAIEEHQFTEAYLEYANTMNFAIRRIKVEHAYVGKIAGWEIACFEERSSLHLVFASDFVEKVSEQATRLLKYR